MRLDETFDSIARKMREDFEGLSGQIRHRGGKGRLRETIVTEYARRWLPKTVSVGGPGEVVTCDGSTSPECDVLLFNPVTPLLLDEQDFRILPAECLYGVLQVKSQLQRKELQQDYEVIRAVKSLNKVAYGSSRTPIELSSTVYGREWPYFPTWGCIFAYQSMSLQSVRAELESLDKNTPLEQRTDIVVMLDKGLVVNQKRDGMLHAWCDQGSVRVAIESRNPIMLLTLFIQQVMSNAWMPDFDMKRYLDHVNFGTILPTITKPSDGANTQ